MSYTISKTDGSVLVTLLDGTTNTDTGLTLIGRNVTSYGDAQNENFVRLLENFASNLPPGESVGFTPLAGQLWWDTTNKQLKVYNGAYFVTVSEHYASSTAPTNGIKAGDQWYDTVNQQLNTWTGTAWQLIGPSYNTSQGVSGTVVETLQDSTGQYHTVSSTYTAGNLVSITSYDNDFTINNSKFGLTRIKRGINLLSNVIVNGTSSNSETLANIAPTSFARVDRSTTFTSDISVDGNLKLINANIFYSGVDLLIQNKAFNGNINFYVNSANGGNVRAFYVDGTTGLPVVAGNPATALGVATKQYADQIGSNLNSNLITTTNLLEEEIDALRQDYYANITLVTNNTNANLNSAVTTINSNVTAVDTSLKSNLVVINSDLQNIVNAIASINNTLPTLAPLDSPGLVNNPTVPIAPIGSNNSVIAATAYVDTQASLLIQDYNAQITSAAASANANLINGLASKANINSPTFTGLPNAPTPTAGDNSTKIATTAFVNTAITAQKFNYTVSSSPPSGGNNGDFWFQIG